MNDQNCDEKNRYVCEFCLPPTEPPQVPTTTTTAEPRIIDPCEDTFASRLVALGKKLSNAKSTLGGRSKPLKFDCEDICAGLSFSYSCTPCAASSFIDEASCTSPGPFGQGEVCQQDGSPCCSGNLCEAPTDCDCTASTRPLTSRMFDGQTCHDL
jgi:hypothetical protein